MGRPRHGPRPRHTNRPWPPTADGIAGRTLQRIGSGGPRSTRAPGSRSGRNAPSADRAPRPLLPRDARRPTRRPGTPGGTRKLVHSMRPGRDKGHRLCMGSGRSTRHGGSIAAPTSSTATPSAGRRRRGSSAAGRPMPWAQRAGGGRTARARTSGEAVRPGRACSRGTRRAGAVCRGQPTSPARRGKATRTGSTPGTVDPRTTIPRTARSAKPMTPQKTVLLPSADDRATQACPDEKSGHKNAHQRASPQQRRDLITRLDHERRDPALRHRLPHGALATQLVRRALGRGTRPVRPNHDSRHPPAQAGELLTRLLGDSRLSRQRRGHRAHQPDPAGTACGANREGVPRGRIEVASDPRFEDGIVLRIDVDVPALQDAHLVPVVRGAETLLREECASPRRRPLNHRLDARGPLLPLHTNDHPSASPPHRWRRVSRNRPSRPTHDGPPSPWTSSSQWGRRGRRRRRGWIRPPPAER